MSFSETDNSFSLSAIPFKSIDELNTGLWLVLVGINETPPHIALISEGRYYSQSTRKVDNGTPLERFLNAIERKKTPTVFVNIAPQPHPDNYRNLENDPGIFFQALSPLSNTENTCLSPIKAFFTANYSTGFRNVNYVFELLALADKKNLLNKNIALFCKYSDANIITLPKYTATEIRNKIQELSLKQIS